jgi:hypothetical protein
MHYERAPRLIGRMDGAASARYAVQASLRHRGNRVTAGGIANRLQGKDKRWHESPEEDKHELPPVTRMVFPDQYR